MNDEKFFKDLQKFTTLSTPARSWFKDVLTSSVEGYDFEKGSTMDQNGVSFWFRVHLITKDAIFFWQIKGVDANDASAGLPKDSSSEIITQVVPYSKIISLVSQEALNAEGKTTGAAATITLPNIDFIFPLSIDSYVEDADHEHVHDGEDDDDLEGDEALVGAFMHIESDASDVNYDTLSIAKSLEDSSAKEVKRAVHFIRKLSAFYAVNGR